MRLYVFAACCALLAAAAGETQQGAAHRFLSQTPGPTPLHTPAPAPRRPPLPPPPTPAPAPAPAPAPFASPFPTSAVPPPPPPPPPPSTPVVCTPPHLKGPHNGIYHTVFPLGSLSTWLKFLVVVVASSQLGGIFTYLGLPLITGYMFIGALVGPDVLALIGDGRLEETTCVQTQPNDLLPLTLVTQCALAFICFSAGSELYLPELRSLFKQIMMQTSITSIVTFFVCTFAIIAVTPLLPFLKGLTYHHCRGSVASICASIMVARSPASAIALVKELKAKGPFTSASLGMTVLGDVYVLILFSLTTSIARTTCDNEKFSILTVLVTLAIMLLSIVLGWFVGRFLIFLMLFKSYVQRYLILPLGLGIFIFSHWLGIYTSQMWKEYAITLESLLICIVAGYVCTNHSNHRNRFMAVLGQLGPYVFLPFFTLTGATLKLRVLAQSFGFAAVIAIIRAVCIFLGSSTGGYLSGIKPFARKENTLMWMCLLTQAGVSLGLASEIGVLFPSFGGKVQTALVAVILVNQVVGPILFRVGMRAVGEAGKADTGGDEWDEDSDMPHAIVVGKTPGAMALAAQLLKNHWSVMLVCATEEEERLAASEITSFGKEARSAHREHQESEQARRDTDTSLRHALRNAGKKMVALPGAIVRGAANVMAKSIASMDTRATAAAESDDKALLVEEPAADVERDEHGHIIRKLEDSFRTVALTLDMHCSAAAAAPPPAGESSESEQVLAASTMTTAPESRLDQQISALVATSDVKRLSAIVFAASNDMSNLRVAAAVRRLLDLAPKKSPLRSVRCLALLRSPGWSAEFEQLDVMPVHVELHSTFLAAKLLSAPHSKPITVLGASATLKDLCKAVSSVVRGDALKRFGAERYGEVEGDAESLRSLSGGSAPSSVAEAEPKSGNLFKAVAGMVPRSFAELKQSVQGVMQGEEVSAGDRMEFRGAIAGLDENVPLGADMFGGLSARSAAQNLNEIQMIARH